MNACHYFDKFTDKETMRRFIFETLGRHILDVHKDFKGVKIKKGRKTIMHLTTRPTVKPSKFVFQKMEVSLFKPTIQYQSSQEMEIHPHTPTTEPVTKEMARHHDLPNNSTPLQMDGHPNVTTSESVTKAMADHPHEPTSTSASQETKSHPPKSTSEPVTKEMANHTGKPNKSAPQEMNDQPDIPTSECATKEITGHPHKPTSTSASQEPESHPPISITEIATN